MVVMSTIYTGKQATDRMAATKKHAPNQCLVIVREAFGLDANGKEPTVLAAWLAEGGAYGPNTHTVLTPPLGVPGFFLKPGHKNGHVVMCLGDGWCLSSDFSGHVWVMDGEVHRVPIANLVKDGYHWLGWSETLEGKRVHAHVSA